MPDEADLVEVFLDDVVAHPADPGVWLILADWLADRDDPRSELVRLSWQLRHEPGHPDFSRRQGRVQGLLAGGMVPVVPRRTLAGHAFVWVPPGSFLMGSPAEEAQRDPGETQRRVPIAAGFWMGVHPVTQGQWLAVMGDTPSAYSRTGPPDRAADVADVADADLERFPVESVTWDGVREFCARLGRRIGQAVRLPTEAEWEYACRAGTTTAFSFGDDPHGHDAFARFSETGQPYDSRPDVVGRRKPNAFGLHDMHGNICEWCDNGNPPVPYAGFPTRGGTFHFVWCVCRSAARALRQPPGACDTGFRVCFTPA